MLSLSFEIKKTKKKKPKTAPTQHSSVVMDEKSKSLSNHDDDCKNNKNTQQNSPSLSAEKREGEKLQDKLNAEESALPITSTTSSVQHEEGEDVKEKKEDYEAVEEKNATKEQIMTLGVESSSGGSLVLGAQLCQCCKSEKSHVICTICCQNDCDHRLTEEEEKSGCQEQIVNRLSSRGNLIFCHDCFKISPKHLEKHQAVDSKQPIQPSTSQSQKETTSEQEPERKPQSETEKKSEKEEKNEKETNKEEPVVEIPGVEVENEIESSTASTEEERPPQQEQQKQPNQSDSLDQQEQTNQQEQTDQPDQQRQIFMPSHNLIEDADRTNNDAIAVIEEEDNQSANHSTTQPALEPVAELLVPKLATEPASALDSDEVQRLLKDLKCLGERCSQFGDVKQSIKSMNDLIKDDLFADFESIAMLLKSRLDELSGKIKEKLKDAYSVVRDIQNQMTKRVDEIKLIAEALEREIRFAEDGGENHGNAKAENQRKLKEATDQVAQINEELKRICETSQSQSSKMSNAMSTANLSYNTTAASVASLVNI